jgi:hypothetical protein
MRTSVGQQRSSSVSSTDAAALLSLPVSCTKMASMVSASRRVYIFCAALAPPATISSREDRLEVRLA